MVIKYFRDIPISVWNRNKLKQDLQRHPICLTESDHNYILNEMELVKDRSIYEN